MTIDLYTITDDPRKLEKTLTNSNLVLETNVNMKEGGDVLHPHFTIAGSDLHAVNYVYIARYGRYYFARTKVDPAGRWIVDCDVDVLMSHAAQLKNLTVTVDRSESIYNGYLPDAQYKSLGYRTVATKIFPDGLTSNSYILITTG